MDFIKANKFWIGLGLIGVVAIGLGIWGFLGGSEVEAKMATVNQLTSTVRGLQSGAQNSASVAAKAQEVERRKQEAERAKDVALGVQKYNAFYETVESGERKAALRKPLVEHVLPAPAGNSDALTFREAYSREFEQLTTRLEPGEKPTPEQIQSEQIQIDMGNKPQVRTADDSPWDIHRIFGTSTGRVESGKKSPLEVLRGWAASTVAFRNAENCRVYVEPNAFGRHRLVLASTPPTAVEIWQAQMSLWIQQDIVTAIARCNEKRARELIAKDPEARPWVAYMPIKHIEKVSIGNQLGGPGGGSNIDGNFKFATSMTGKTANNDMFVVPIQLQMVVEETALPAILEEFCNVGFYTPIGVQFYSVKPNPLQVNYVYGDAPVVKLQLDLEGYFFHVVFGQWIPKELQDMLKKPYVDTPDPFGGGGGGGGIRAGTRR